MKHSYKIGQIVSHREYPNTRGIIVQQIVLRFMVGGCINGNELSDTCPPYEQDDDCTEQEYNDPWYRIVWITDEDDVMIDTKVIYRFETPTTKYNGQESEGQLVPK